MFRKHTDVLKAWNGQNTRGDVLQPEFDSERGKEARQAYREYYDSLPLPDDWAVLTLNRTGYCMCICDWCMKHNAFSNPPGGLNEHYPENVSNPEHKTMHRLYAENIGEPATSTPDAVMRAPPVSEPGSTVSQVDKNGYPLPDGWRQQTTTQGVLSYWHVMTDKRQWEYPGIVPSQVDADGNTLPAGWTMLTPSGGTPYYLNTVSGKTQWEHPGPGPSMNIPETWNDETRRAMSEH